MCVCSGKVNSLIHIKIYIIRSKNYKYEQEFFSRMFVTAKKLELFACTLNRITASVRHTRKTGEIFLLFNTGVDFSLRNNFANSGSFLFIFIIPWLDRQMSYDLLLM